MRRRWLGLTCRCRLSHTRTIRARLSNADVDEVHSVSALSDVANFYDRVPVAIKSIRHVQSSNNGRFLASVRVVFAHNHQIIFKYTWFGIVRFGSVVLHIKISNFDQYSIILRRLVIINECNNSHTNRLIRRMYIVALVFVPSKTPMVCCVVALQWGSLLSV